MFRKTVFRAGLSVLLLVVTSYSASESITSEDTAKVGGVKTAPAASAGEGEEVIISIGDKKLTMQQVNWMQPNASDSQITRIADWWIQNELLHAEAQKRGITNQPKAKFFAEIMMKNAFRNELVSSVQDAVKITDAEISAYYEKNKQSEPGLRQQGYLSFTHVRTKTLEEAQDVLEKIKAGDNINELARKLSIYRDAKRDGVVEKHMYRTIEGRFGTKFLEAIKTAKDGELIGPIKVRNAGYEVARKESRIEPKALPFEEVKDRIRLQLRRSEREKTLDNLLDSLKKEASDKIVKSPQLIKAEKAAERPERNKPAGAELKSKK